MILWTFISFITVVTLLPVVKKMALKAGFVDIPDERKQHVTPVPPIGGLVVVPAFICMSLLGGLELSEHLFFVLALLLVWGVGAVDDRFPVSAITKFGLHMIAAVMVVMGNGSVIYYLGDLFGFGEIWTEPVAFVFSVLCIVFVINAINMIDGLDGLCGGVVTIMLCALTCAAMINGGHAMVVPMMVLIGALSGFLVYNYRHPLCNKASLFMGDSGSTSLGLILSWMVIELTQNTQTLSAGLLEPALIAWVLALPVFDTLSLFVYRITQKRSPFSPDRRHVHHLICDGGKRVEDSVNLIHIMTLLYCLVGVIAFALLHLAPVYFMPLWVGFFLVHFSTTFGVTKNILVKFAKQAS